MPYVLNHSYKPMPPQEKEYYRYAYRAALVLMVLGLLVGFLLGYGTHWLVEGCLQQR